MPLYLVRHAHAGSRDEWVAPDGERPLSDKGWRRAEEIARALAGAGVSQLWSSPLLRCVQTLEPLGRALSLEVATTDALAEGAALAASIDLVERLAADDTAAALCSHGDVIPELLAGLARRGAHLDPGGRCPKGSIWILHTRDGAVTDAVYGGTSELPVG